MTLLYDAPLPAPNPRRVRIFLAEKGISAPTKPLSIMTGEHKAPAFVAKYPPGQLPVLELDDGTMIGESVAICRYFEGLHPELPLFGTGPLETAAVEMWTRRVEFTLGQPVRHIWLHTHPLTARVVKPQYAEFGEANRPLAMAAMTAFDSVLAERAFLAGDNYSVADIALQTTIDFAAFIGVAMPEGATALHDWHKRVSARPSAAA